MSGLREEALPAAVPVDAAGDDRTADQRLFDLGVRLAFGAGLVVASSHLFNHFVLDDGVSMLSADGEARNPLTWGATVAAATAAFSALLLRAAWVERAQRLVVLAALLAFFSLDDAIQLHERAAAQVETAFGLPEEYGRVIWPALWMPLLATAFLILLSIAREFARQLRRTVHVALALLVAAVVGEALSLAFFEAGSGYAGVAYHAETAFEEGAEIAAWLLVAAVLATAALRAAGRRAHRA